METLNNVPSKSGIFTKPARNQYTDWGLLLHTNYSLLLIEFTITVTAVLGPLMTEEGEEENHYSPKFLSIFQPKLDTTKGQLN